MALFFYKFGEYMINQKQFNIIKEAFLIYEIDFKDYELHIHIDIENLTNY